MSIYDGMRRNTVAYALLKFHCIGFGNQTSTYTTSKKHFRGFLILSSYTCSISPFSIHSADDHFDVTYQPKVVVTENGSCLYVAPIIYKSFCKMDLTWFPFDYQRCELKFGSWAYDGFEVRFSLYFLSL